MSITAKIINGDDVSIVINVKDKASAVIDLSGVTALTFKVNNTPCDKTFISKTLGAGVVITDATAGEVTVTLTDSDTSDTNLPAGDYIFELQITDSSGNISTVRDFDDDAGKLEVLPDLDN